VAYVVPPFQPAKIQAGRGKGKRERKKDGKARHEKGLSRFYRNVNKFFGWQGQEREKQNKKDKKSPVKSGLWFI